MCYSYAIPIYVDAINMCMLCVFICAYMYAIHYMLFIYVSDVRGEVSFRSYALCYEFLRYIFLMVQIPQRGETIFQQSEIVVMGKSIKG